MPPVAVCSVKSPRVSGQQRLQHPRRRSLLHFQEQMEVVRHQNVGVKVKRITLSRHRQTVEKRFVVAVVKKYLPPVVAAGHHMIEQSLRMDSGMSGHKAPISKLVDLGKSDTGMPSTPECRNDRHRNDTGIRRCRVCGLTWRLLPVRSLRCRCARGRHARAPRAAGSRRAWSGSRLLRDRSRHEY